MFKLMIIKKENEVYTLEDEAGKEYTIDFEFHDIEKMPEIGDYIVISDELLDKNYDGYSTFYAFGSLESVYGKSDIELDDVDVIQIVKNEEKTYLKRIYG